jgi:hypothetical protein
MRRSIAAAGAVLLGLVVLTPGAAAAAPKPTDPGLSPADRASLAAGVQVAPKAAPGSKPAGPNPFLAMLANPAKADYAGWSNWLARQDAAREQARLKSSLATKAAASAIVVDEDEPDGTNGSNESPATAQLIPGFGTGARQASKVRILGSLDNEQPVSATPNTEDDGSIALARDTGVTSVRTAFTTTGTVGDGPHAATTGDFDFYKVTLAAGQSVTVAAATPTGSLDTFVQLYAADGTEVAFDDDGGDGFDSRLVYQAEAAGAYYAVVAGYGNLPADPNDPASGDGSGSTGPYTVTVTTGAPDVDFFAVNLKPGDVLGASVKGSPAYLTVYDTTPREVHGSGQDASSIYPAASPLPGGGNAVTDYVATKAGWHYVGVSDGDGAYDITVEAYRPPLEKSKPVQTLFLDFDGARVNTAIFGGPGNRDLSPFSAFVAKWGLTNAEYDAVVDGITARVTENIKQDLIASGLNSRFKIKILNSKDDPDPWGKANVSRIVVGGTVAESGVDTIGIAQSIDPGNFATEETALVLLDYLSEPAPAPYSLNTYITPASDKVAFVSNALGNVIAHEAGHYFGNWHTDQFDAQANLMDQGGNFPPMFGVGPDNVGGTADDVDVDFGDDTLNPNEGFVGIEDTLGRIVFGVTS